MPINSDRYAFTPENIELAPNDAGVYQLEDAGGITYIGRAAGRTVTIHSRLRDHQSGREGPCTQVATHYRREVTNQAADREEKLLEEHLRQHRRLPRCNDVMP